jgi:hypothetical protein
MMLEFISKTALAAALFLIGMRIFEEFAHVEFLGFQRKAGVQSVTTTIHEQTQLAHDFDVNGDPITFSCCGCWNLVSDEGGFKVVCNECGDARDPYHSTLSKDERHHSEPEPIRYDDPRIERAIQAMTDILALSNAPGRYSIRSIAEAAMRDLQAT